MRLRTTLLWFSGFLLLAGSSFAVATHTPVGLGPAVIGAVVILAVLFERRGYKRIVDRRPGPDWQPTGERFLDPTSETLVEVYFQPETGKRSYVRVGSSA